MGSDLKNLERASPSDAGSRFVESEQVLEDVALLALRVFAPPPTASGVVSLPDDGQSLAGCDSELVAAAGSVGLRHMDPALVGNTQALFHAAEVSVASLESGQTSRAQLRRDVPAGVGPGEDGGTVRKEKPDQRQVVEGGRQVEGRHAGGIRSVDVEPVGEHLPDEGLVAFYHSRQELVDHLLGGKSFITNFPDVGPDEVHVSLPQALEQHHVGVEPDAFLLLGRGSSPSARNRRRASVDTATDCAARNQVDQVVERVLVAAVAAFRRGVQQLKVHLLNELDDCSVEV